MRDAATFKEGPDKFKFCYGHRSPGSEETVVRSMCLQASSSDGGAAEAAEAAAAVAAADSTLHCL